MENIAFCLKEEAGRQPRNQAVIVPRGKDSLGRTRYTHLTFQELDEESDFFAWGLEKLGIRHGMKTLLMIRPSLDFYSLVFALFKLGAVPVMIDPGMGWRGFFRCVTQVKPEAMIGIPAAHLLRHVVRAPFRSVKIKVSLGKSWCSWGGCPLKKLPGKKEPYPVFDARQEDLAAILFTSGSTGPAKGVEYPHGIFARQLALLRDYYQIGPGQMDLACFPLFSLFSVGLGAAAVIPDMDPTHPALVDPEKIIGPIRDLPITYSFGSPALWERVSRYCLQHQVTLPGLKQVIMAGAPVPARVHDALLNHILDDDAETYTPYGATESLPLCNFTGHEVLHYSQQRTADGAGTCVGIPLPVNQLKIIRITDDPIPVWDDSLELPHGQIGEICVCGPTVTRRYYQREDANRMAKIANPAGDARHPVWHRVGDLGYLDEKGYLWFCGRKAHRVETPLGMMCSVCCEARFNSLPGVRRTALVGKGPRGRQEPILFVEPVAEQYAEVAARPEIFLEKARQFGGLFAQIHQVKFLKNFPVDVRHNAKISRETLAALLS